MSLSSTFLNATINSLNENTLKGDEPSFPGNYDILHGQYLHRPDSVDVDLYRFVIDLGDDDRVGTLTAETFAERLADSSSLDTSLQLFKEEAASTTSDFGLGNSLSVRFDAMAPGKLGNNVSLEFIRSDRTGSDNAIRITQKRDSLGNPISNGIVVDIPRVNSTITTVPVSSIVNAINDDAFASGLVRATLTTGAASTNVGASNAPIQRALLDGGGIVQISRNDDYFSEDSRIIATLGAGIYYVGVAASGNETYDPTIPASGYGGLTQGKYELQLKFEQQVDETEVIRDLDNPRLGVPGTPIDGDGDGTPGGAKNFWFQTRPENRQINFTANGTGISPGQTIQIIGANGAVRTYEFVADGASPKPGNVAVPYSTGLTGAETPSGSLATALAQAVRSQVGATGVEVNQISSRLEFTGERSIETSVDFRGGDVLGRNIFVDKSAGPNADGSLEHPFNNIANSAVANAFDAALSGDIVRIVGNGGQDGDIATEADNFSYQVGVSLTGGLTLEDGRNLEVPQGVTTMIDAGAVIKLRSARIGVGSSSLLEDRSNGALQVLGTPRLVDISPTGAIPTSTLLGDENNVLSDYSDGSVIFTSISDLDADSSTGSAGRSPSPGDWGGLVFRRDLDLSEGRADLENEGIFLQSVNHAQIRYGGGSNLLIDSVQQLVNPIQIFELRPSITFNEISFSADAAISASPDSFEETSFQAPKFQQAGAFTADYSRVGPSIYDNVLVENSINGLFIRVVTTPGTPPRELTLAGRFDDTDVVHYFPENVVIAGTPGGSIQDGIQPDLASTAFATLAGGSLVAGTYDYRLVFVDGGGFESLASDPSATVTAAANSSIQLLNLQPVPTNSDYLSRRLYRLDPASGQYRLVATLDANASTFIDDGSTSQGVLDLTRDGIRGRLDASLVIDPGTVLKFRGSRLELGQGAQLLAEGTTAAPVVFTSYADDRFGSGGTFDTNNDNGSASGEIVASRGDWSGIYAAPTSFVSLDHATVAYGGGVSLLEGGQSRGFAALELQQAEARITNGRFEFNEDGQDGAGPVGRFGRLGITPSTIFVRDSQPTIVGNTFVDNRGTIIDIDSDSMTAERLVDLGRQTGVIERFESLDDNYGPLIRLNRYENVPATGVASRQITGLEIRGGVLSTESVWDDTDIVHLLFDTIEVNNLHSSGGLRLISRPDESLVVKLDGAGSPFSESSGTGLSATGALSSTADRVGGSIQIVGLPGSPVVLTSFLDDTVGAGLTPEGRQFTDNNGDSFGSRPEGNNWRSILLDQYSNDRNVDYILEQTITSETAPGLNGTVANAQVLGAIAPNVLSGDDQLRLGFEVEGFLQTDNDVDTYSFTAEAGTRIWVDIDKTSFTLDSVIEVLDANGNVLARSNNSFDEVAGTPLESVSPLVAGTVGSLQGNADEFTEFGVGGLYEDFGSMNPRDAGLSLSLPGNRGTRSVYFFRVRSASVDPGDVTGGITNGGYRFQVRLREDQEFAGSVVRYADIRYANNGIHVRGLPGSSPLLGDAQEDESVEDFFSGFNFNFGSDTDNGSILTSDTVNGNRAQYIGNLLVSKDKSLSVGGALSTANDIDFYQIDVNSAVSTGLQTSTIFDIDYADGFSRPNTTLLVYYDSDGEEGILPAQLIFVGEDSNVLDDQSQPVVSSAIDLLTRGSVSTGDPLIGPVSLSEGTYYVGIVGDGVTADALDAITTRREPIESILRLFEDHVEEIGGSTALAPRNNTSLFDRATLNPGWTVTTDRATDPGHQRTQTFNGSRNNDLYPASDQFETFGNNDTFINAQSLDTFEPLWSLQNDPNIGNSFQNTSQLIPHTTVFGSTTNEVVDIYRFDVAVDGSTVILDVDDGVNPNVRDPDTLPEDFPTQTDPNSVDLKLQVFDITGAQVFGGINRFSQASDGAFGSEPTFSFGIFSEDPYLELNLAAGTYFVAVSPEDTAYDAATGLFSLDVADRPRTGTYELNVSVENHANSGGDPGNESYHFDRSEPTGTMTSVPFDLAGYGPGDLPRFYFNYFYSPAAGDTASIRVTSNENPAGAVLTDAPLVANITGNFWRQGVASLSDFAGHTNIQIEFNYNVGGGTGTFAEGLFLDDFMIGFAERGELITGAALGDIGVTGFSTTQAGEYQLEVRPGTEYGTPSAGGFILNSTFDTNSRQGEVATIVAPHASQLVDGNTFTLSDGVRSVKFEFDLDTATGITPGNIRVPYTATSGQSEIADAIRSAINLSVVRSTIQIQASDSTGSATGGFNDNQVAISGLVLGDFIELNSADDLPASDQPLDPAGGAFRLPVIFNQGTGDSNVIRSQSQVIVDSNKISNVRAIGIFSEPSNRGIDPEDRTGTFLDSSPVGTTNPGAVRNLPTLNNEVVGGQTPGIVIRNNTIDQAGFAGIKVEGEIRPWVIDSSTFDLGDGDNVFGAFLFGNSISDGLLMVVDAADTRVIFEFEDIGGDATTAGGSGQIGGNGFADGHVPIYIRHDGPPYNGRSIAHTRQEVMLAIYEAINSSILVTNGMSPLVKATLGTSLRGTDSSFYDDFGFFNNFLLATDAAVYIEGVTNIEFSFAQLNPPPVPALNPFDLTGLAPIHDAPQPVSRIVNNTIYGNDGTASQFGGDPTVEPNDVPFQAVDTRIGSGHTGAFTRTATLGDSPSVASLTADVDMYRVDLVAGDRLTVDVDTLAGGPDTVLRLFDSSGVEVAISTSDAAPDYLDVAAAAAADSAIGRTEDPFLDFTTLYTGTYFVGVSSEGNAVYDALSTSGRVAGNSPAGDYDIAISNIAPRTFVMSVDNGSNTRFPGANTGIQVADFYGTTFTVTQVADTQLSVAAGTPTNQRTFEFTDGQGGRVLANGNINVPLQGNDEFRVPDVVQAIAYAISGDAFVSDAAFPNPPLPNHSFANGPDGLSGPLGPVLATALGGADGSGAGLRLFPFTGDFTQFGHNRTLAQVGSGGFVGTSTLGSGVSELYTLVERAANITISPEAAAAGLRLDPAGGLNIDQLLPETGVLLTGGSSGTVVNNVFSNLHQGVVDEYATPTGFFPVSNSNPNVHPKQAITIVTANVFQHIESANNVFRQQMTQPFVANGNIGITPGPSNVNGGTDDFNITLGNNDSLFVNPEGGNFLPASDSVIIDSSVNSLTERDRLAGLLNSVGLPISNVLAPNRDINGVLRADNPDVAPPGGLGSQIFKDRGSNELADFVGPAAIINVPMDNDAEGIDVDPSTGFLRLTGGVYREFRIQLRDTGDSSDPFSGLGIDDDTVVVPAIDGVRSAGANVTLFEDERLLTEGLDYTFSYDKTQNVITLTPLAGIWQDDRSYRIALNNQDRTVLTAPDPSLVKDGDQLLITDDNGGTLAFEFESGYELTVPETITLIVPEVGTNAGGLRDGDIFSINDGVNPAIVFELDSDGVKLPGSVAITLPSGQTPTDPALLETFLEGIAQNIRTAIATQTITQGGSLDVDVRVLGKRVVIGAEAGATASTTGSGLVQAARTLALRVPATGVGPAGIQDGNQFFVNNGNATVAFEFDTNGATTNPSATVIDVNGLSAADVAIAMRDAINASALGLTSSLAGDGLSVYLNLPVNGSASVVGGLLGVVGVSRTPVDGDTIVITSVDGSAPSILELNRTDERDANGGLINDMVGLDHVPINLNRATTADELAGLISNAIRTLPPITGLPLNGVGPIAGGVVTVGGEEGLSVTLTGRSLQLTGAPSVTGASTIEVFGPLLLTLPLDGGGSITTGSSLLLIDDTGNSVVFEFKNNLDTTPPRAGTSVVVAYDAFSTVDIVANNLVTAINGAGVGITAINRGVGQISLGRIASNRVDANGFTDPTNPFVVIPGLSGSSLRRGIVGDGETVSIRQGATQVTFEFEAAVGGGGTTAGNVQVAFQTGSSVGDVAISLAAAINNNKGLLQLNAVAELDGNGDPTGRVNLNDQPGTVIDVSSAPTLNLIGIPGGATPVRISPAFSAAEVKQALINAINSVNVAGETPVTTLSAENRGGDSLFVLGGASFDGPISNYALPAIADLAGNPLEPNRGDETTQFTILMPTVGLDYGDAPDPVAGVTGRYPTSNANNGPRHVVDDSLFLGQFVDSDTDGSPSVAADGDDTKISGSSSGLLFGVTVTDGELEIVVQSGAVNPLTRDGDTITIDTGVAQATLEFDLNGRFDEDNFAISPADPTSPTSITAAIIAAINESPLKPASIRSTSATVVVSADDEDGVVFTSDTNPAGVLNRGVAMPIDVSVTGAGIVEAWIDFNADGDWDDPGEQVLPMVENATTQARRDELCPANLTSSVSNIFADTGELNTRTFCIVVPATAPVPTGPTETYARFRVSREGNLTPTGLALSGEVEDYALTLLPGLPPTISSTTRSFTVDEDRTLQALDGSGALTSAANDNGLLSGVVDTDGNAVAIFRDDVGVRTLLMPSGNPAGELNLFSDGTFTFTPVADFNGVVNFFARVSDVDPLDPANELVSSHPISVTITVDPVNDPPVATSTNVIVSRSILEDEVQTFAASDTTVNGVFLPGLIASNYASGPANETGQPLVINSVSSSRGSGFTNLGGRVVISNNGLSVTYTPPADYNGTAVDTFNYSVADVPGAGQVSEVSSKLGTVTVSFQAVNDAPRTQPDNYVGQEDVALLIPIRSNGTTAGVLDNDTAGPDDEVTAGQTVSLVASQFPIATSNGGMVTMEGSNLRYVPPRLFSGIDNFQYSVADNLGAVATGAVSINVGGVNNNPSFIGINGNSAVTSITRDESKTQSETVTYDLTTWFSDPESDPLTFAVTSSNPLVVATTLTDNTLVVEYPPFSFGTATLTVTATDTSNAGVTVQIPVTVSNTPDPPSVIGTLDPLAGTEDQVVIADLGGVFADPDNEQLTYGVARLGNIVNPTTAQIAAHPLVQSIAFPGDEMRITLKPDQFGSVDIEISATDGSFRVSDSFTLNVAGVPDAPIAVSDGYNVPIGGRLQIVNPSAGLLRNDSDSDGETILIDMNNVVGPAKGALQLNTDGTFSYESQEGSVGETDSFTYRVSDSTGRFSNVVTVTLTLNQSSYQNPLTSLSEDVNADGVISAIDALRVINFLSRSLDGASFVPVSSIGAPPPDYFDANGDGRVSAADALKVINQLSRINNSAGELVESELVLPSGSVAAAVTTGFASASSAGLAGRQIQLIDSTYDDAGSESDSDSDRDIGGIDPRDAVLATGFEISSSSAEQAVLAVQSEPTTPSEPESVDEALATMWDAFTVDGFDLD
ncbi:MAG: tandem-95 repeat protein [Rubripirellula sp.]